MLPAVRDLSVKCYRIQPSESRCLIRWQYPDVEDHIQFVLESRENRSTHWMTKWLDNKDMIISFESLKGRARIRVWAQLQSDNNVTSPVVRRTIDLRRAVRLGGETSPHN